MKEKLSFIKKFDELINSSSEHLPNEIIFGKINTPKMPTRYVLFYKATPLMIIQIDAMNLESDGIITVNDSSIINIYAEYFTETTDKLFQIINNEIIPCDKIRFTHSLSRILLGYDLYGVLERLFTYVMNDDDTIKFSYHNIPLIGKFTYNMDLERPCIVVEKHNKWYEPYLLYRWHNEIEVEAFINIKVDHIMYDYIKDFEDEVMFSDHNWDPMDLLNYCKNHNLSVGETSYKAIFASYVYTNSCFDTNEEFRRICRNIIPSEKLYHDCVIDDNESAYDVIVDHDICDEETLNAISNDWYTKAESLCIGNNAIVSEDMTDEEIIKIVREQFRYNKI